MKHRPFINGCARLVMKGGPYEDQTNLHRREVSKCICFAPFRNITDKWTPSLILRSNVRLVIKCQCLFQGEVISEHAAASFSAGRQQRGAMTHTSHQRAVAYQVLRTSVQPGKVHSANDKPLRFLGHRLGTLTIVTQGKLFSFILHEYEGFPTTTPLLQAKI